MAFVKELEEICRRESVEFIELRDWVWATIDNIQEKTIDYYIATGSSPDDSDRQIDVNLIVDRRVYSYSKSKHTKAFFIYPIGHFEFYREEFSLGFITCTFSISDEAGFYIADKVANSARLQAFTSKIRILAWGER